MQAWVHKNDVAINDKNLTNEVSMQMTKLLLVCRQGNQVQLELLIPRDETHIPITYQGYLHLRLMVAALDLTLDDLRPIHIALDSREPELDGL